MVESIFQLLASFFIKNFVPSCLRVSRKGSRGSIRSMCSKGWKHFPLGVKNLQPLQFVTFRAFVSSCPRALVFQNLCVLAPLRALRETKNLAPSYFKKTSPLEDSLATKTLLTLWIFISYLDK